MLLTSRTAEGYNMRLTPDQGQTPFNLERLEMTLRERLHHQIDQLDTHQLAAIDMLLAQLTRPQKPRPAASPVSVPPYVRAQRMMAGHRGLAQDAIDSRADRV
jgi:hypothetical protein